MLEKEAEKYTHTKHCEKCSSIHCEKKCVLVKDDFETFKDGAEFGYNKANEWHYPSKGEYPKENCKVYLYAKDKECYIGFLENGAWKYESGFYASDNFVIAWKEIVLPKEILDREKK